jgi:hypothetical protein
MVRRGSELSAPEFDALVVNDDDSGVENVLSRLLGIPQNMTDVPVESTRESYEANVKHTYYYLFQKQTIVANKDQLFYRQNEQFQPQAIRDTLPILLGYRRETGMNWKPVSGSHSVSGASMRSCLSRLGVP